MEIEAVPPTNTVIVDADLQWTKHGTEIAEAHRLSRFSLLIR